MSRSIRSWRYVVGAEWLSRALVEGSGVQVIDASWHMPSSKRSAREEYEQQRVPGAVFFDLDDCCDKTTDLPHMMPKPHQIAEYLGNLGIGPDKPTVVYDTSDMGIFSSPRLWWMLTAIGMSQVAILDGGFRRWKELSCEIDTNPPTPKPAVEFPAPSLHAKAFVDAQQVLDIVQGKVSNPPRIIDARSAGRFTGMQPEPRPGLQQGHIPSSTNIPFTDLLDSSTGCFKDSALMEPLFEAVGAGKAQREDESRNFVFSCGSGVTACVPLLAMVEYFDVSPARCSVYDGAFAEWGIIGGPFPVEQSTPASTS